MFLLIPMGTLASVLVVFPWAPSDFCDSIPMQISSFSSD